MSPGNVLAVAGAARKHPAILAFGLLLSVTLMGVAANFIARLLNKHRWIAYVGLAIILFVALRMIFHGGKENWYAGARELVNGPEYPRSCFNYHKYEITAPLSPA
ncbi:MAG TPA: hypothetical protein ENJ90_04785 [Devosia sp.]|nr:hypothetical protein [Devosia sp.]